MEGFAKRTLLMISHKGEILPVPISGDSVFHDVVARVIQKWPEIRSSGVHFRYGIGSYRNCSLKYENDFASLQILVDDIKPRRVEVDVIYDIPLCPGSPKCNMDSSTSSSIPANHINTDTFSGVGSIPSKSTATNQTNPFRAVDSEVFPNYNQLCPPISTPGKISDSWASNIVGVGQKFLGGNNEFRQELSKYACIRGFKYTFVKNNKTQISVVCAMNKSAGCQWRITGTSRIYDPVFRINKATLTHNCTDHLINDAARRIAPKTMGDLFVQNVQEKPDFSGKAVQAHLSNSFGFTVGYMKAWRTLQAARDKVYGTYSESFNQLRWYGEAVKMTNPGSVVEVIASPETNQFSRFFVAFNASIQGFKSCRPMLFIDATSLKGKFKGQLLSATAKDGDNGLFPVALAIVDAENIDNWTYFIRMVRDNVKHDKKVFYLSDRHAGIMAAFEAVFEEPCNFYCLYHLYTNLKGMYRGGWSNGFRQNMVNLLQAAAYAPTKELFHKELDAFIDAGQHQALAFLEGLEYDKWAVSFSPNLVRYGEMTSNAAESFNKMITPYRALPVCHMIDSIRQHIMSLFNERRVEAARWTGALCPHKERAWNAARQQGRGWKIVKAPKDGVYEVMSAVTCTVDINANRCSCFQWQVQGFPCVHAINVIAVTQPTISGIVAKCFFTASYREAYQADILPIPTSMKFDVEKSIGDRGTILPPNYKPTAGRPKKKRIPSFGEIHMKQVKKWKCMYCNHMGRHEPNTCAAKVAESSGEKAMDNDGSPG